MLKSLGLTPAQVVVAYLSRVGWPAVAGCLAGVVVGNVLAAPVLHDSAGAYGVGSQQVPWWASVAAPILMLALTALAALGPALRAGRLSAVQAIAAGRAPRTGRGYAAHRLAARLHLPRPVGLGLAAPFARPARTAVSLAAIAFGATAVIFAFGLNSSLSRAAQSQTHSATVPVQIQQVGPGAGPQQIPDAAQDTAVTTALRVQPGTRPGWRCCPWPRSRSRPPGPCCRRAGRPAPGRPSRCAPNERPDVRGPPAATVGGLQPGSTQPVAKRATGGEARGHERRDTDTATTDTATRALAAWGGARWRATGAAMRAPAAWGGVAWVP